MINQHKVITEIDPGKLNPGQLHKYWLSIVENGIGQPILIPVIAGRGRADGPTVGITAAVHGNELNGLRVIEEVFRYLADENIVLRGTVVGVPVVNIPSLLIHDRRFVDGEDLNRIMPGREGGTQSEVYAWRFTNRVLKAFDYLFDLHTASAGRVNSYYIRADLNDPVVRDLAQLQKADIILHNEGHDGNLRSVAMDMGIKALTLEVGNPGRFQTHMIEAGMEGILNALAYLGMIDREVKPDPDPAVVCERSYWLHTTHGGILTVLPDLAAEVRKGEIIGELRDVFGEIIDVYRSPEDGVIIGKSVLPVGQTGSRIVHLGIRSTT